MDYYEDPSKSCEHLDFPANLPKQDMLLRKIKQRLKKLLVSQSVQNNNFLSDLHKNPDKLLYQRRLYKWNAIQIQLHKNIVLRCGLGWPEWTYTRIWGVDKKATFSHKSSKFDTRIWKEEFISSIRNMCAAVESILIMFKNVEKTRLCPKVWAIKAI